MDNASCSVILERYYSLSGAVCEAVPGGWTALAVKAFAGGEVYFLGIYEKHRAAVAGYAVAL